MKKITVEKSMLTDGASIADACGDSVVLTLSKRGAGFVLPETDELDGHFLTFRAEVMEEHGAAFHLFVYVKGENAPAFTVRFGLLPKVNVNVCIDLDWMDARRLFPEAVPGMLKIVCHGRRVKRDEIDRIVLSSLPCFHPAP